MKRIGLFCALFFLGLAAGAQKVYFIYVQSESGAPFYVRLADKVSSSAAAGYVILPGLRDSTYLLQVGFPGGAAESRFSVALNHEDKGFVLKQVGGAWNLFDLQELTLIKAMAAIGPTEEESRALLAQADPFTRLLVQASDDLSLLSSGPSASLAAAETVPPAPVPAVPEPEVAVVPKKPATQHVDTTVPAPIAAVTQAPVATDTVAAPVAQAAPEEAPFRRSQVTRRSESSTTEGFGLVFIDSRADGNDTIRLLIPNPQVVATVAVDTAVAKKDTMKAVVAVQTPAAEPVTAAAAQPVAKVDTVAVAPKAAPRPRAWAVADVACATMAEERDFVKLRKAMTGAGDEAGMVAVARKELKKRCYTVAQVKQLGGLFLSDLARYNFFLSAWDHVSDQHSFPELELELKDTYLADRLYEQTRPISQ